MGEDDYTEVESYKLQAFSANRNRDISLNDSFKSHFKRQYHLLSSLSRIWLGQGIRSWPLSIINWASPGFHTLYKLTDSSVLVHAQPPFSRRFYRPECTRGKRTSRRSFADRRRSETCDLSKKGNRRRPRSMILVSSQ